MEAVRRAVDRPCPICESQKFRLLVNLGSWPMSGQFVKRVSGPIGKIHMALEFCTVCFFVRRRRIGSGTRNYRGIHRVTKSQKPRYLREILAKIGRFRPPGSLVLEIGSNDGAFLLACKSRGIQKVVGVEPSPVLARHSRARGLPVLCDYFNPATAHKIVRRWGAPGGIVCRHTLEHVPDPRAFLEAALAILKPGGRLYVECPDSQTLLGGLHWYEIWDEHENYFTRNSMGAILQKSGFCLEELKSRIFRDATNLCCWAQKVVPKKTRTLQPRAGDRRMIRVFPGRFRHRVRLLVQRLRAEKRKIICLGAGHPQTNFVLAARIGAQIHRFVDDDPSKFGKYVFVPTPKKVISTREFLQKPESFCVLATAFPYPGWMRNIKNRRKNRHDQWLFPYRRL